MDYSDRITIEPGKRGGQPCIRGLRITVQDVLEYLASGMSTAEILTDFPDLEADDIRAALAFAADRERRFVSAPAKQAAALRLLLDHNLSPRLARALEGVFETIVHVRDVGLAGSGDRAVWDYAGANNLIIVSKDADFHHLSFLFGGPPKVVWIRRGNCSTGDIAALLRDRAADVRMFGAAADVAFMELW